MIISSWTRFAASADIVIHSELRLPFCIVANELRLNDCAGKIRRQRRHTHTRSTLRNTPGSARERIGGVQIYRGVSAVRTTEWTSAVRKLRSLPDDVTKAAKRTRCCRSCSVPVRKVCCRPIVQQVARQLQLGYVRAAAGDSPRSTH